MEIKSFIIAKHPAIRDALARLLSYENMLTVNGSAKNVAEAIPTVAENCADVVVWDVSMSSASDAQLLLITDPQNDYIPQLSFEGVRNE